MEAPGAIDFGSRYEMLGVVGQGATGTVFHCVDKELHSRVALKVITPRFVSESGFLSRIRREVLVARSLSHDHIVKIYDIVQLPSGQQAVSMEFVNGCSLRDLLRFVGRIPVQVALKLLNDILDGMIYAHRKGVIHRDIKPANVLVSRAGEVKLVDFGTARVKDLNSALTLTGELIGTPDYMAPEQLRGEEIDEACDLYALGILAFELFTGQKPFTATSPIALSFKHLNEPVPKLRPLVPDLPRWIEDWVVTAAAKKRSGRFSSAEHAKAVIEKRGGLGEKDQELLVQHVLAFCDQESQPEPDKGEQSAEERAFVFGLAEADEDAESVWVLSESDVMRPPLRTERRRARWPLLLFAFIALVASVVFFGRNRIPSDLEPYLTWIMKDETPRIMEIKSPSAESPSAEEQSTRAKDLAELLAQIAPEADELVPKVKEKVEAAQEQSSSRDSTEIVEEGLSKKEPEPVKAPEVVIEKEAPLEPVMLEPLKEIIPEKVVVKKEAPVKARAESLSTEWKISQGDKESFSWQAKVHGFPSRDVRDLDLGQGGAYSVNLFSHSSQKVLSRNRLSASTAGNLALGLSGRILEKDYLDLSPGRYRLDLLRDGEFLSSVSFIVEERFPVASAVKDLTAPAEPTMVSTGTTPLLPRVSVGYSAPKDELNSEPPVEERGISLVGSGSLEFAEQGSLPLQLNLKSAAGRISGTAKLDAVVLLVSGKAVERGSEFVIYGEGQKFRCSGVVKGDRFRGRCFDQGEKRSGRFQVFLR